MNPSALSFCTHTGCRASKAPSEPGLPFCRYLVLLRYTGRKHRQAGAPSCIPALRWGRTIAGPSIPTAPGLLCPSQRARGWLCPPGAWVVLPSIGEWKGFSESLLCFIAITAGSDSLQNEVHDRWKGVKVALRSSNYLGPLEQKARLCYWTKGVFYVTSCLEVCNADINTRGTGCLTLWANLPVQITICWGIVFREEAKSVFSVTGLAGCTSLRYDLAEILGGTRADTRGVVRGFAEEMGYAEGFVQWSGTLPAPVPAAFSPFLLISWARNNDTSPAAEHLDPKIPCPTPDSGTPVAKDHLPHESNASIPQVTPLSPLRAVPRGGRKAGGDPGDISVTVRS